MWLLFCFVRCTLQTCLDACEWVHAEDQSAVHSPGLRD